MDVEALAAASDGLAGADLKRVIEDGKLLFAFDREKKGETQPSTAYFLRAVETVRRNKQQYAEAETRARVRHPHRPAFFDPMSALATLACSQGVGFASVDFDAPHAIHQDGGQGPPESR